MSFWLDAGTNSLSAFRAYSVSPRPGSTMRIPQCALRHSGALATESAYCASVSGALGAAETADVGAGVVVRVPAEAHPARSTAEVQIPRRAALARDDSSEYRMARMWGEKGEVVTRDGA